MKLLKVIIPVLVFAAALTACDKGSCGCMADASTKTQSTKI